MLKQKKWVILLAMFLFGLAVEIAAPEKFTRTAEAATPVRIVETEGCIVTVPDKVSASNCVTTEEIWKSAYRELMYGTEVTTQKLAALAVAEVKKQDLELMTSSTDHIVNYHGERFAITDDEYQVLLKIVEAEAPDEDIKGKMLVANVVLNRLELGFGGDTISEVVFAKGQFEPVSNGRIFKVTPSEKTIEAVERVLKGEDESQGALYFMARKLASKKGIKWFDENLVFLFKHGGHEFFTEKE